MQLLLTRGFFTDSFVSAVFVVSKYTFLVEYVCNAIERYCLSAGEPNTPCLQHLSSLLELSLYGTALGVY